MTKKLDPLLNESFACFQLQSSLIFMLVFYAATASAAATTAAAPSLSFILFYFWCLNTVKAKGVL